MSMKTKMGKFAITAGLGLSLLVAGCGAADDGEDANNLNNNANDVEENNNAAEENDNNANNDAGDAAGVEIDEITGIDAGAGVMQATEEAIEVYDLDIELTPSSDAAMVAALESAINNEEEIIVTGWTPHWKFGAFDIKYLEDPEGVFGEAESIHSFAREGLEEDHPSAYTVLDNFQWEEEHMNEVMVNINQEGMAEEDAAADFTENHSDLVDEWTEGVEPVDGDSIQLGFVAWDSEIASSYVIGNVLEELGYDVEYTPLEAGGLFSGLAAGDVDGSTAGWLPVTHGDYLDQYGDDFEDLGPNLEEGAEIGLVVPEYMDVDSIEDLR